MRESRCGSDGGEFTGSNVSQHRYVSSWRGQRSEVGGAEDVAQEHQLVELKAVFCIKIRGWKGCWRRSNMFGRTKGSLKEEERKHWKEREKVTVKNGGKRRRTGGGDRRSRRRRGGRR